MKNSGLPPDLQQLIAENIDSVHTLEILLFLYKHREEVWTVEQVNAHVKSSPAAANRCLRLLEEKGVIARRETRPAYQYEPRSVETDRAVHLLHDAYRERSTAVIRAIHGRSVRS